MTTITSEVRATEIAMSPERIWLSPRCDEEATEGRAWGDHPMDDCADCHLPSVEYVRADLARKSLASEAGETEIAYVPTVEGAKAAAQADYTDRIMSALSPAAPAPDVTEALDPLALIGAWKQVTAERERQISQEGWTPEHDDKHANAEMLSAAVIYLWHGTERAAPMPPHVYHPDSSPDMSAVPLGWPWDAQWWKPKDRFRNLVRAGALCLAEHDRCVRAKLRTMPADHKLGIVLRELAALASKTAEPEGVDPQEIDRVEAEVKRALEPKTKTGPNSYGLCEDCPPIGYPTDKTRCAECPRRQQISALGTEYNTTDDIA